MKLNEMPSTSYKSPKWHSNLTNYILTMSKMKEIDDIAQGIADVTKELMYDSIDWQLADQNVVGDDYNELHSYVMQLAIRKMYEETRID